MKRDPYGILKRPVVTEKSQIARDEANKVVFEVQRDANKIEIAKAVSLIYGVEVESVHTMVVPGKIKRVGRRVGRLPNWKKAVVTLAPGATIDFFEGI